MIQASKYTDGFTKNNLLGRNMCLKRSYRMPKLSSFCSFSMRAPSSRDALVFFAYVLCLSTYLCYLYCRQLKHVCVHVFSCSNSRRSLWFSCYGTLFVFIVLIGNIHHLLIHKFTLLLDAVIEFWWSYFKLSEAKNKAQYKNLFAEAFL